MILFFLIQKYSHYQFSTPLATRRQPKAAFIPFKPVKGTCRKLSQRWPVPIFLHTSPKPVNSKIRRKDCVRVTRKKNPAVSVHCDFDRRAIFWLPAPWFTIVKRGANRNAFLAAPGARSMNGRVNFRFGTSILSASPSFFLFFTPGTASVRTVTACKLLLARLAGIPILDLSIPVNTVLPRYRQANGIRVYRHSVGPGCVTIELGS